MGTLLEVLAPVAVSGLLAAVFSAVKISDVPAGTYVDLTQSTSMFPIATMASALTGDVRGAPYRLAITPGSSLGAEKLSAALETFFPGVAASQYLGDDFRAIDMIPLSTMPDDTPGGNRTAGTISLQYENGRDLQRHIDGGRYGLTDSIDRIYAAIQLDDGLASGSPRDAQPPADGDSTYFGYSLSVNSSMLPSTLRQVSILSRGIRRTVQIQYTSNAGADSTGTLYRGDTGLPIGVPGFAPL